MNASRRKQLSEVHLQLFNISSTIEGLQAEEQAAFDNMPEGLQQGEKGEVAQAAADALQEAIDELQTAMESVQNAMDKVDEATQ